MNSPQSPGIESVQWGKVILEGARQFKDVKLYPGGAREWDWNETGTHHSPGSQLTDVQELLDHGATVVVLSLGQLGRLAVAQETLRDLDNLGVEVHMLRTPAAVEKYSQLRGETPVGALLHSTC